MKERNFIQRIYLAILLVFTGKIYGIKPNRIPSLKQRLTWASELGIKRFNQLETEVLDEHTKAVYKSNLILYLKEIKRYVSIYFDDKNYLKN